MQQTESLFSTGVLHFPLPTKFRMSQIEMFDGTKDPIDHLNTYKNHMELHGYQELAQKGQVASKHNSSVRRA